ILENVPRVLPDNLAAHIDAKKWELPPIFRLLSDIGELECADMATTLNCGLGMIIVCAPAFTDKIRITLEKQGETVYAIGEIKKRAHDPVIIDDMARAWKK